MKNLTIYNSAAKVAVLLIFLSACKSNEMIVDSQTIVLDTLKIQPENREYRPAHTKSIDILHTKLNLSFNWDSAFVIGEATITLKPYFYSTNAVLLDAKGYEIHEIKILQKAGDILLKEEQYEYDGMQLLVNLDKIYSKEDTLLLYVKYTAMPDKIEVKGSAAITEDKGMYFINKDDSDPKKPRQLWTQGETESNSCWFPTVDKPNEKFTTEIYVTIEEDFLSISNGLKMFSVSNNDGTKTEYWKMDKPHAAYLVMLAVGPFAEYKDKWNEMEVNYYLDSAYFQYAHDIFGNTPEMLEFYSEYLGVPYPWQKYDQVVVHDYVSGAMENTTATIHGEFLQRKKRELIEYDGEDIIAHELFHHWFGDLVTCESWSNLTLNEGFATYGEYLWEEYKYGRSVADLNFRQNMMSYLYEAQERNVDMIRFYYDDKEDMFDSHSYSKGGLILHMLRGYVGDEAFREALKHYLNKHAYQSVEIHDLRIAFEEVTGEDLNWFFNQWYLASGHPKLEVKTEYNTDKTEVSLYINQVQDMDEFPTYTLPVYIEYKTKDKLVKERYTIEGASDTLKIKSEGPISYINFDPGKYLLSEVELEQSDESWMTLYRNSSLAIDQWKALTALEKDSSDKNMAFYAEVIKHENEDIRSKGLAYYMRLYKQNNSDSILDLVSTYANDESWRIRYTAISFLKDGYDEEKMKQLCMNAVNDSSIWVSSIAISSLGAVDPDETRKLIQGMGEIEYSAIAAAVAGFYMDQGLASDHETLIGIMGELDGYAMYQNLTKYSEYLQKLPAAEIYPSISFLKKECLDANQWWVRMAAINTTIALHKYLKENFDGEVIQYSQEQMQSPNMSDFADEKSQIGFSLALVRAILEEVEKKETRANLVSNVSNYLEEK